MASACRFFRERIHQALPASAPKVACVGNHKSSRANAADAGCILYVQRSGLFVRRSIFSQRLGVRALREGINGAAVRSIAHPKSLRSAGKSGKRNEVVAEHDLLHHEGHEGRSATTKPQWRVADSLRSYRTR